MLRHERPVIQIFLPVLLVSMLALASVAVAQKRARQETIAYTPPNLSLVAEPAVITVCPSEGQAAPSVVHLDARVTSNSPIRYRWTTNAGRIDVDGATVTWDVSGLTPGSAYRVRVTYLNNTNITSASAASFTILNPTGKLIYVNDNSTNGDQWCTAVGNFTNSGLSVSAPLDSFQAIIDRYPELGARNPTWRCSGIAQADWQPGEDYDAQAIGAESGQFASAET